MRGEASSNSGEHFPTIGLCGLANFFTVEPSISDMTDRQRKDYVKNLDDEQMETYRQYLSVIENFRNMDRVKDFSTNEFQDVFTKKARMKRGEADTRAALLWLKKSADDGKRHLPDWTKYGDDQIKLSWAELLEKIEWNE